MDRFGRWASLLFGAFVVLDVIFVIAAIGGADTPAGARLLAVSGVILGGLGLTAAIVALANGRPWANAVAVVGLLLFVISGIVDLVANLSTRFTIPIGAIAAVIVLLQRPPAGESPWAPLRAAAPAAIIAALVVSTFWPQITTAALEAGASPFAVPASALVIGADVECGTALTDGEIVATISWSWRTRDVLPGSTDGLFVRWTPPVDSPDAYFDQAASTASEGVWSGSGSPATTLTQPLEQADPNGTNTTFGIDVAGHGQLDGFVRVVLHPEKTGAHGSIEVAAAYAHLDRWLRWSDPATCTW